MYRVIIGIILCFSTMYTHAEPIIDPPLPGELPGDERESQPAPNDNRQEGDLNTNTQNSVVDSNNKSTTNIGAGAGSPTPVTTAIAPSLMSSGSDTCLQSKSGGMQLLDMGLSAGAYKQDEECNRRRDARMFKDLGMTVAALSRMCQNDENWKAMFMSGSPCPIMVNGKLVFGKRAVLAMKTNPEVYIPQYKNRKNKAFYDAVLGIGNEESTNGDENENVATVSVSERFRTSSRKSVE